MRGCKGGQMDRDRLQINKLVTDNGWTDTDNRQSQIIDEQIQITDSHR